MPSQDSNTPPSHVTVAVVLQVRDGQLQALLWQRAREPFAGAWSLPGGRLRHGETLADSIRAHLATKVDVRELAWLEQLETLSEPDRHPDEWQLATAYLGLVPSDVDPELPPDTRWLPVDELPDEIAFDHAPIVLAGRERLRAKLSYTNIGFAIAPETLHDLPAARPLHRRARVPGVRHEPPACAGAPPSARGHRRPPLLRPRRRPPRRRLPLPLARDGGHGPVRGAAAAGGCRAYRFFLMDFFLVLQLGVVRVVLRSECLPF